jgi:hypothetical protein
MLFFLVSVSASLHVLAEPAGQKKSNKNSAERQHEYQEAVNAMKNQVFLLSLYSFVDKKGNLIELEPEGNFILVNKDKFMMQKSIALNSNTFAGSDNFKGDFLNFQLKESRKGNIQFSFDLSANKKGLTFKGKMNNDDNTIEGRIKGQTEESEIVVTGNIQPVQARFVY